MWQRYSTRGESICLIGCTRNCNLHFNCFPYPMLALRAYYFLKPILPWSVRTALRRWRAARRRVEYADVWPIKESAGVAPAEWPGWPDGKRFALVLTHDVESPRGVSKSHDVMEMEAQRGFRSSFNFVPEGYAMPEQVRRTLLSRGFEVGVHDLRHNGKLYFSRGSFERGARRINHYLKDWGAVGFRSGFMLHQLEWLHDLQVMYDASTFDTDPFEPQPDGVSTIFPLWVPRPGGGGYVELPYTLVQDYNLFVILQEKTIDIWKKKLDWIVSRGGMALLDTHPDYMALNGAAPERDEYPVGLYLEFLDYVKQKYEGQYWHALPRDVAQFVRQNRAVLTKKTSVKPAKPAKIWIDLDNTPHVPFFRPIIRELEKRGHQVLLTARDAFQVCELATHYGLPVKQIGRHYGKNSLRKIFGLVYRALQLLPFALKNRPTVALSHGARSQMMISNLLRIPTILLMDYEFAKNPPLVRPRWEIVPESVPYDSLYPDQHRVRKYVGIKEDVYAPEFRPDPHIYKQLGLTPEAMLVTMRPPATEAHYHNPESEKLFVAVMEKICGTPETQCVLLPRNKKQGADIRAARPDWFKDSRVIIPEMAVEGLNLLWHSDLVVSGGGTMNREAAALGVPVYSIFRGKIGGVDRRLQEEGRLVLVENLQDVENKIVFQRRNKDELPDQKPRAALRQIVDFVEEIIWLEKHS